MSPTLTSCMTSIEYITQNYAPAQESVDKLLNVWESLDDKGDTRTRLKACINLKDTLKKKIELHEKIKLHRQVSKLFRKSRHISLQYKSISQTSGYEDVFSSLDIIEPELTRREDIHKQSLEHWKEVHDMLLASLDPIIDRHQADFSDIINQTDSGYW